MNREQVVTSIYQEVGEFFQRTHLKSLRLPLWDDKGTVVAIANALRNHGYTVTLTDLDYGHELLIIRP